MKEKIKLSIVYLLWIGVFFGWGVYALSGRPLPKFLSGVDVFNIVMSGTLSLTIGLTLVWALIEEIRK